MYACMLNVFFWPECMFVVYVGYMVPSDQQRMLNHLGLGLYMVVNHRVHYQFNKD